MRAAETHIKRTPDGEVLVERFSPIRRVEHMIGLITISTLFLTGLPQKFDGPVAAGILSLFGGLDTARLIHRTAGIIMVGHAFVHITAIVAGTLAGRMRLTLLPTLQDLRDARDNLLYYFGFRKHGAELPKFDYRQKFEYLGMVLGGLVMVFSGLVLLFPQITASFLPGVAIPVARVMHTNEAVLAFLVLIVWHVYGSHLSPDVWPMDKSIFTGYQTIDELKHHHALEYRRLFPDGVEGEGEGEKEPEKQPAATGATG